MENKNIVGWGNLTKEEMEAEEEKIKQDPYYFYGKYFISLDVANIKNLTREEFMNTIKNRNIKFNSKERIEEYPLTDKEAFTKTNLNKNE